MEHVNTEMLSELKALMEDEFGLLVDTYCSDGQVKLEALEEAVNSDDAEKVREMAHSLKGSSSNVGAEFLSDICCKLESKSKNGDLSDAQMMLEQIKQEFQQVSTLIKQV